MQITRRTHRAARAHHVAGVLDGAALGVVCRGVGDEHDGRVRDAEGVRLEGVSAASAGVLEDGGDGAVGDLLHRRGPGSERVDVAERALGLGGEASDPAVLAASGPIITLNVSVRTGVLAGPEPPAGPRREGTGDLLAVAWR